MNFLIPSKVAVSLLLLASNGLAHGNHRLVWQNSESAVQSFKIVSGCTERIWPNYSWKGVSFLAVKNKKPRQVAFDVDTQKTYRISLNDLENSQGALQNFDFFQSNGKNWLSVNESFVLHSSDPQGLFGLGAHEGFHFIGQKGWAYRNGERGTNIPVRWEPRYYRAKLYSNLREAFLNPSSQDASLGKAAFWFDKWKSEFAEEIDSVTDGYEGTAEYAEFVSRGLAALGCGSSEQKLRDFVRNAVNTESSFAEVIPRGGFYSLDSEGYPLGAVASFILKWQKPIAGWENRVALKAETPVEILLENVKRVNDEMVEGESIGFKALAEYQQKRVDSLLSDTLQKLQGDHITLSIPLNYKSGSTRYAGFFKDAKTGNLFSVLSQPLIFQGDSGKIQTVGNTVTLDSASPCREFGWKFVIGAGEIQSNHDHYFIHSLKIIGSAKGSFKTLKDGKKFFCVGEQ